MKRPVQALKARRPGGPGRPSVRKPARRQTLVFALSLVALMTPPALAVGHRVLHRSPATAEPVGLPALPAGWTVVSDSSQRLGPSSSTNVQTLVTSWRYRPTYAGPASVIPPGGVIIDVTLSRDQEYRGRHVNLCRTTARLPQFPARTPPLTLPSTTTATLDGAPHVKEFRVLGRYRDSYNFEVRVDIDTRRPVRPRWARAETIIRELRFPRWPALQAC